MAKELKIDLSYLPVINFAMQQNHVPVIREISLKNTGDELITDITLTVDFDPQFAAEYTTKIDRIIPGGEERISVVPIVISTDFLSNLTERISGTIKLTARASEDILAECQNEISILTYNEWCGESVMPAMIAAFCTPNHPGVIQINKRASEILNKWTGDPSLNAYQTRNHNRDRTSVV